MKSAYQEVIYLKTVPLFLSRKGRVVEVVTIMLVTYSWLCIGYIFSAHLKISCRKVMSVPGSKQVLASLLGLLGDRNSVPHDCASSVFLT